MFLKFSVVKNTGLVFLLAASRAQAEEATFFRFAVMGCAHLGVCSSVDYERAVEKIKEQKPDFVLFLGGMIDAQGTKPADSLWQKFDRITAGLDVPVYNVYGDCGLTPLSRDSEETALSEKLYLERYKKRYASFIHKNNLFMLLDSDKLNAPYGSEQLKFLESSLSDASKYDHVFLVQHHSPWSQEDNPEWVETVRPLIQGKVNYVFGAGEHFFDVRKDGGTTYITSGVPSCLSGRRSQRAVSHFLLADVNRSRVNVSVVPLTAIPLESFGVSGRRSGPKYKLNKQGALDSADRRAMLPAKTVLKALKIKPGMNIADIGSGTGFFTFPIAEALNGTGMVFAVDIDPGMTEYVNKRIENEGYENIHAATVAPGLDPFYKKHTFDIVLLSEVFHNFFWRPEEYLRPLKQSLSKAGGRLYVIHFKPAPDFSEIELGDFSKPLKILKSGEFLSPILEKISEDAEEFVVNWKGDPIPEAVREKLLSNLNKLLTDRWLLNDIMMPQRMATQDIWNRLSQTVFGYDLQFFQWIIADLIEKDVFAKAKSRLSEAEKFELKTLNRILLTGIFRSDKLYFLKGDQAIYVGKRRIIKILEDAGFTFVQEHEGLPYHYFLEFK